MNHFSSRGLEILTQYLSLLRRSARSSRFYLASLVPQSASFILTRSLIGMAHAASLSTRLVRSVYSFGCPFLRSSLGTAHAARLRLAASCAALAGLPALLAVTAAAGWPCGCPALAAFAYKHGLRWQSYFPALALPSFGGGFLLPCCLPFLGLKTALPWPFGWPSVSLYGWSCFRALAAFLRPWLAGLLYIRRRPCFLPLLRLPAGL